jgi:hypothetical protein
VAKIDAELGAGGDEARRHREAGVRLGSAFIVPNREGMSERMDGHDELM